MATPTNPSDPKKLICIRYPGFVQNPDRALENLGGLDKIADVCFSTEARTSRLELKFRPQDLFCKPACGDKTDRKGLLIKVKRPGGAKSKGQQQDGAGGGPATPCPYEVVGYVETIYKFESMCDFQYLPVHTHGGKEPATSFLEKVSLSRWKTAEEFFVKEADGVSPLFLTPYCYSRFDRPTGYNFRDRHSTSLDYEPAVAENDEINVPLRQRSIGSQLIHYASREVPSGPSQGALDHFSSLAAAIKPQLATLTKIFEQRPVWCKSAIADETRLSKKPLKCLLPVVAYYYLSGPWRYCWVRFGYDPRKDPEARIYQVIDFRARKATRRKIQLQPTTISQHLTPATKRAGGDSATTSKLFDEMSLQDGNTVVLGEIERPSKITDKGVCLRQTQVMFQICDVDIPVVRDALAKPAEQRCHETDGFFPLGTMLAVRDGINQLVDALIRKTKGVGAPASPDAAGGSGSRLDGDGDEDEDNDDGDGEEELEEENEDDEEEEDDIGV